MVIVAVASVGAVLGGLAGYWNAYQAAKQSRSEQSALLALVGKGDAGQLSFVVLPFNNLTGDPQQEYVSDGLTAAVTADLSRITGAFVVSGTTAAAYKGKALTAQRIGQELGIRYVLQAGVQRAGNQIRVLAQLADASSGALLWAESFDGDATDLVALQETVTTRVGNSVGTAAVVASARSAETRKASPQADDLVLRARALFFTAPFGKESCRLREQLYRKAVAIDPDNLHAQLGLAVILALIADNGFAEDAAIADRYVSEAQEIALKWQPKLPPDSRVLYVLGVHASFRGDFEGSIRASQATLELEPKDPLRYSNLADDYIFAGQPERAVALISQGIRIDPRRVHPVMLVNMARAQLMLGEPQVAISWLLKAQDADPRFVQTHVYLAAAHWIAGDESKARAAAQAVLRAEPRFALTPFDEPRKGYPPAFARFRETVLLPACRSAGLRD